MQKIRSVAATKASDDFRNHRTLPTARIGAIAAALWATRQIFGVNLTHVGTTVWAVGAGSVVVIAILLLLLMRKAQHHDEQVLRRLFDADVQGYAFSDSGDPVTRADYRTRLRYRSVVPARRLATRSYLIRRLRRWRTNKMQRLEEEALERLELMGNEAADSEGRSERLWIYGDKLHSYNPSVPGYSQNYILRHHF